MKTTIVVPVYNAAAALNDCLNALASTVGDQHRIRLINDASTDPKIVPLLDAFARRTGVTVHHNECNLGFVGSINGALSTIESDVILLNSDTIVTPGWLTAMQRCADSDPAIATITPFSNNAEICSLPVFCRANSIPSDPAAVSAAIAACSPPTYPELPTAVGFCMFIRQRAWRELGGFDPVFGHGYGEENDFCRHASAAGWRNVLCDDAYVVHVGGQSFGELGLHPGGENLARLVQRHPDYSDLIAQFIARDPLAKRRAEIIDEMQRRKILAPTA